MWASFPASLIFWLGEVTWKINHMIKAPLWWYFCLLQSEKALVYTIIKTETAELEIQTLNFDHLTRSQTKSRR